MINYKKVTTKPKTLSLGSLSLRNELKKNLKNLKRFAKTQTIATIKIISYYLSIMYFYSIPFSTKSAARNILRG